jgi:hypothetical protein
MNEDEFDKMNDEDKKILILNTIHDLVGDFLRYDRKEDEYLPIGVIEECMKKKIVTPKEMASLFEFLLKESFK